MESEERQDVGGAEAADPAAGGAGPRAGRRRNGGILEGELTLRFLEDASSGVWGHPIVAAVTLLLFWGAVDGTAAVAWFVFLLLSTGVRMYLTSRARRLPDDPVRRRMLVLGGVVLVAGAWGAGGLLFGSRIPAEELGILLVIMAGLVAAASATLEAEKLAFHAFSTLLLGSVFVGVALRPLSHPNLLLLLLVVAFWAVMAFIHGRSHQQLVESLEIRRELRETQADYEDLVESAHDLVWRVDGQGRWIFLNSAARDIYGASPGELLGTVALDRADGEHREVDYAAFARVLMGGELVDHETVHQTVNGDDRYLSFSARPLRASSGEVRGAQGTARDVSDRVRVRKALEEVAEKNSLVRSLINATPDLIFYKNAEGVYQGCNFAFADFYGKTEEEIVGKTDDELIDAERARVYRASDREAMTSSEPLRFEEWIEDPDGNPRLMETLKTVYRDPEGKILGLLGVVRDVTERKEAEERMRELAERAAHATRMKSAFLANMSHEIRTPMNGVLGMTEILLETDLREDQRQSLEIIRDSGEALLAVLNDILDISKIEAGHLELEDVSFDLHETVVGAAQLFTHPASKRGNELVIDIRPDVPRGVRGDPTRLRQILSNLVGNAVKFTQDGEILVSLSLPDKGNPSRIRFSVRDTGVGIAEEKQESIFQEFTQVDSSTTRQYGGTGLGLTISKHLVSLMGGELGLESEEGEGSDFFFTATLPEDQTFTPEGEDSAPVDLREMRALVVDDLDTNRRIIREFLESAGAAVRVADGAEEALTLLREARGAEAFDFALLDVLMPQRDGFQLAEDIRLDPQLRDLPLMILTSSNRPGDRKLAERLRVESFLHKPVSRPMLLRGVGSMLRAAEVGEGVGAGKGPGGESPGETSALRPEEAEELPAGAREGREEATPSREPAAGPVQGMRVLLAEDNPVNQQVALALLERWGCEVRPVMTGTEVLETLEEWVPELILMDVQMPEMDGLAATRKIRQDPRFGGIPILALTAHALSEERARCRDAGMDDYLSKPYKAEDLQERVEHWARQRTREDPAAGVEAPADSSPEAGEDGTASEPGEPPVLIEEFRASMREAGIEAVVESAIQIYLDETPKRMEALEEAVESGDLKQVESEAHGMKSGSRNLRAELLGNLLERVEHAAKDGREEEIRLALPKVREEFHRVMDFLEEKGTPTE